MADCLTYGVTRTSTGEYLPGVTPDSTGHLRGSKSSFYEGGIRVPGIIEWPGEIELQEYRTSLPVRSDMFPTLIDVADLDPGDINQVHDGISLVPVFDTEPERRHQPLGFRVLGQFAWLDNDYKLVYYRDYDKAYVNGVWDSDLLESLPREFELYNVVDDPSEQDEPHRAAPGNGGPNESRTGCLERIRRQERRWERTIRKAGCCRPGARNPSSSRTTRCEVEITERRPGGFGACRYRVGGHSLCEGVEAEEVTRWRNATAEDSAGYWEPSSCCPPRTWIAR